MKHLSFFYIPENKTDLRLFLKKCVISPLKLTQNPKEICAGVSAASAKYLMSGLGLHKTGIGGVQCHMYVEESQLQADKNCQAKIVYHTEFMVLR